MKYLSIMAYDDEIISTLKENTQPLTLISFVGFQKHLVMTFFQQAKKLFGNQIRIIYLFHGQDTYIAQVDPRFLELRSSLNKEFNENWKGVEIRWISLRNLWDIKEIYGKMEDVIGDRFVINISAGPSIFGAASLLFGLKKGSTVIGHVIERPEPLKENKIESESYELFSIFTFIDLDPYLSLVRLNHVERAILRAIINDNHFSVDILNYLIKEYGDPKVLGLRRLQSILKDLTAKKVLISYREGKYYHYKVSDDLMKIISKESLMK